MDGGVVWRSGMLHADPAVTYSADKHTHERA
jgi:hypothetical protein